jgi:hypothetical protein
VTSGVIRIAGITTTAMATPPAGSTRFKMTVDDFEAAESTLDHRNSIDLNQAPHDYPTISNPKQVKTTKSSVLANFNNRRNLIRDQKDEVRGGQVNWIPNRRWRNN